MNSADGPRLACQLTPRLFSRLSPRSKVLPGQPFKSRGPFSRAVDFMVTHNNAMIHGTYFRQASFPEKKKDSGNKVEKLAVFQNEASSTSLRYSKYMFKNDYTHLASEQRMKSSV